MQIYGNQADHVPGCTNPLDFSDGRRCIEIPVQVAGITVKAINVPCHSAGSVLFYIEATEDISGEPSSELIDLDESGIAPPSAGHHRRHKLVKNLKRCVFTGDTVFVGGCGKFFEGEATQMLNNMDLFTGVEGIAEPCFPDDTRLFVGHEYAEQNLLFTLSVLGDIDSDQKELIRMWLEKFRENSHSERPIPNVPSLLSDEKKYNIFMMCREKWMQDLIKVYDPVLMMHILREWKNDKKKPGTHIFSQQYLSHSLGL